MSQLTVKFWGVRGSLPSPGPATAGHGGNTSCVEVRAGDELFILDMGSGLRGLGESLGRGPVRATFLLSHYHWDHIQGLPFFGPAYDPRSEFDIYGCTREGRDVRAILAGQMVAPYFPVSFEVFRARLHFHPIASGESRQLGPVRVTARELNHPNGVLGYRLDFAGRSLVYATDTEHGPADDALVELARGADALIYDAMYTPDEYLGHGGPARTGWGHSTWEAAVGIVRRAGVRRLVLFHHDPSRSDADLAKLLETARAAHPDTVAARESEPLAV